MTGAFWVLVLALAPAAGPLPAEVIERVVAKVNGDIITKTELDSEVRSYLERLGPAATAEEQERRLAEVRKQVLDRMVENLLVLQKAREKGLRVPPRYFEEWKAKVMKESRIESEEDFLRQIAIQGMTAEDLKNQFEESVLTQEVRRMEVDNKISVTQPEIEKYYRDHINQYTQPAKVRLREIVFRFEPGQDQAALENAQRVLQDLRQGADFAEMARRHSESASRDSGGDLGHFQQGELTAPLEKVAFALGPGELSDVIRLEKAYYLLKVEEKTEDKIAALEEVKNQIAEAIFQEKLKSQSEKYIAKLRSEAIIEIVP